jgi:hypothetical protein
MQNVLNMMPARKQRLQILRDKNEIEITLAGKALRLTNLRKLFWRRLGVTKRDLLYR